MRFPTPPDRLCDARGRPYFLWDVPLTLDAWLALTRSEDPEERAYWMARVLRDGRPDDALEFFTWAEIAGAWEELRPYLGRSREMWAWLLGRKGFHVQA